jgi:hypothetical protein
MGAYHDANFFLAQHPAAMDLDGAGPDVVASDSAGRFALVRRYPADSGSAKTADAATIPLQWPVEELLGWAALSAEEQDELRVASRVVGTGAGTKMKGRQRKFDEAAGAVAVDGGSGRTVSESNGSDAAEEERDSQSPRSDQAQLVIKKNVAAAAAHPRPCQRSKRPEASAATAPPVLSQCCPTPRRPRRPRPH